MYKLSHRSGFDSTQQKLNSSLENCKNEINQLNSEINSSRTRTELNFQYHYSNQIKNLKFSLVELIRKLSFSNFHHNFINNLIQNMKNMKELYELNSKEMIIKDEQKKLKVENDYLHAKNSDMKTNIINLKNENIELKDKTIYLIDDRIDQNYKFENVQRKQKSFLLNLKDISQSEQNKNILLQ